MIIIYTQNLLPIASLLLTFCEKVNNFCAARGHLGKVSKVEPGEIECVVEVLADGVKVAFHLDMFQDKFCDPVSKLSNLCDIYESLQNTYSNTSAGSLFPKSL